MKITIHRGTHQIGGCATEICTANTRIFIDFGSALEGDDNSALEISGVTNSKSNCNAIFFTHYHNDHIGMIDSINKDIPLYMGKDAKEILTILNNRLAKIGLYNKSVSRIREFKRTEKIVIGDISVIPFSVDHSAFDAYMFLIEADGKRILHTGDFRGHGFQGKGLIPTLEKYVGKADILICEGTTLNRPETKCITEHILHRQIKKVITENKYVFVVCSSTNIDRIASVSSAVPYGKYFLCDEYQKSIIEYISKKSNTKSNLYKIKKCNYYGENLDSKMLERGFCMLVRQNNPKHKGIMDKFKDKNPVIIYSMWKGYLEQENTKKFLDGYKRIDLHTSGHADISTIQRVIETVKPDKIIPIHTQIPEKFDMVKNNAALIKINDKENFYE